MYIFFIFIYVYVLFNTYIHILTTVFLNPQLVTNHCESPNLDPSTICQLSNISFSRIYCIPSRKAKMATAHHHVPQETHRLIHVFHWSSCQGLSGCRFNPCHPSSHEEDEGLRYSNWAALPIMDFNGVFAGKGGQTCPSLPHTL